MLVDQLVKNLNDLGVDENSVSDSTSRDISQINNSTNGFNLRKGAYEYSKGMIDATTKVVADAMTNALDQASPPAS